MLLVLTLSNRMKNIFIVALLLVTLQSAAQMAKDPKDIKLEDLIAETQVSNEDPDTMDLIWWLPIEFWKASFAQDPSTTAEDLNNITDLFEGYELFALMKGKIGPFGGITYKPLEDILENVKIIYDGEELQIEDKKNISSDLNNFITLMKPMMSNMMGPMGENMHFVVFKDDSNSGLIPINSIKKSTLVVSYDNFSKNIELPLGSLILEKKCPKDRKLHSGNWNFCPIHGDPLISQ